jgi:Ca2+-binding EF-hand superfamily protein
MGRGVRKMGHVVCPRPWVTKEGHSMHCGSFSKRVLSKHAPDLLVLSILFFGSVLADEPIKPAEDKTKERFAQADKDGDGKLSADEFVAGRGDEPTARRDFKLFDFDRDGALSPAEFAPIAVSVVGTERGPMPDPFMTKLVDVVTATLDKSLKNWNEHPEVEYDATEFIRQVSQRLGRIFPDDLANEADANRNGKVNREEARRFFEGQLGARRSDGQAIRDPNAMYIDHNLFFHVDENKDDSLDKKEWLERSHGGDKAEGEFAQLDLNKNGSLAFDEFKALPRAHKDPIDEFRQLDKNLDARVDQEELTSGIADWKKRGTKYLVGAFDMDHDGALSLEEWMVTPHANELLDWFKDFKDIDGDKKLGLGEFVFEQRAFPLLRLYFFRRFDRNGDNMLDENEYEFRQRTSVHIYSINADGTDLKKIDCGGSYAKMYGTAVSPDGKWVAFSGSTSATENATQMAIQVVPIEGGEAKTVCSGMQPSWSKDGTKIACTRYQPQYGSWIIDLVGDDDRNLGQGWGAHWSPDGSKIGFIYGVLLKTYDVETQQTETALPANALGYQQFMAAGCWSPDSKRMCASGWKGQQKDNVVVADLLIIDMENKEKEPKDRIKVRLEGQRTDGALAWHPDGKRIVLATYCPERKLTQLYEFDPDTDEPPKLFPGQPEDQAILGGSWTPDGKRFIFSAGDN